MVFRLTSILCFLFASALACAEDDVLKARVEKDLKLGAESYFRIFEKGALKFEEPPSFKYGDSIHVFTRYSQSLDGSKFVRTRYRGGFDRTRDKRTVILEVFDVFTGKKIQEFDLPDARFARSNDEKKVSFSKDGTKIMIPMQPKYDEKKRAFVSTVKTYDLYSGQYLGEKNYDEFIVVHLDSVYAYVARENPMKTYRFYDLESGNFFEADPTDNTLAGFSHRFILKRSPSKGGNWPVEVINGASGKVSANLFPSDVSPSLKSGPPPAMSWLADLPIAAISTPDHREMQFFVLDEKSGKLKSSPVPLKCFVACEVKAVSADGEYIVYKDGDKPEKWMRLQDGAVVSQPQPLPELLAPNRQYIKVGTHHFHADLRWSEITIDATEKAGDLMRDYAQKQLGQELESGKFNLEENSSIDVISADLIQRKKRGILENAKAQPIQDQKTKAVWLSIVEGLEGNPSSTFGKALEVLESKKRMLAFLDFYKDDPERLEKLEASTALLSGVYTADDPPPEKKLKLPLSESSLAPSVFEDAYGIRALHIAAGSKAFRQKDNVLSTRVLEAFLRRFKAPIEKSPLADLNAKDPLSPAQILAIAAAYEITPRKDQTWSDAVGVFRSRYFQKKREPWTITAADLKSFKGPKLKLLVELLKTREARAADKFKPTLEEIQGAVSDVLASPKVRGEDLAVVVWLLSKNPQGLSLEVIEKFKFENLARDVDVMLAQQPFQYRGEADLAAIKLGKRLLELMKESKSCTDPLHDSFVKVKDWFSAYANEKSADPLLFSTIARNVLEKAKGSLCATDKTDLLRLLGDLRTRNSSVQYDLICALDQTLLEGEVTRNARPFIDLVTVLKATGFQQEGAKWTDPMFAEQLRAYGDAKDGAQEILAGLIRQALGGPQGQVKASDSEVKVKIAEASGKPGLIAKACRFTQIPGAKKFIDALRSGLNAGATQALGFELAKPTPTVLELVSLPGFEADRKVLEEGCPASVKAPKPQKPQNRTGSTDFDPRGRRPRSP